VTKAVSLGSRDELEIENGGRGAIYNLAFEQFLDLSKECVRHFGCYMGSLGI